MLEYGKTIFFNRLIFPHMTNFSIQEGLYYMQQSGLLIIRCPPAQMSYEAFVSHEILSGHSPFYSFYRFDSALFCPNTNTVICSYPNWITHKIQNIYSRPT
jgi:hypothetical protein